MFRKTSKLLHEKTLQICLTLLLSALVTQAAESREQEAIRIGTMVQEIQQAHKKPDEKASLETIVKYGTDTRHYVMIRGWLHELLKGTQSQLEATRDPKLQKKFQQRESFLKQAIRRIDLE